MRLSRIFDGAGFFLALIVLTSSSTLAQDMVPLQFGSRAICATPEINDPRVIREAWENTLAQSPGIVEAVRQFTLQKGTANLQLGDQHLFWVYNLQKKSFDTVRAELKMSSPLSYVWVAVGEWENQHVTATEVDAIVRALETATSPTSLDSTKGILRIAREAYGDPPNVSSSFEKGKGDGKTHFLLCDIQDGWAGSGSYVAGFFYSVDVDPFTGSVNMSNRRDMLYIDSYPGIFFSGSRRTTSALSTLAHEFQHLIHWNYDPREVTFFNEGLSEYAEYLCGFTLRSPLGYFGNTNISLSGWNGTVEDYSRAALWTRFVAEQYGLSFVKKFVQNASSGIPSFDQALLQSGYSESYIATLANFYTANWLGTRGADPTIRYSKEISGRPILRGDYVDPNVQRTDTVVQQGVQYFSFAAARSFRVTFSFPAGVSVKAVESGSSSVRVRNVTSGTEFTSSELGSQFSSVAFVVINTQSAVPFTYSFTAAGELLLFTVEESYDSGTPHAHSPGYAPYLGFGNNGHSLGMAVRFQPAVKGNVLRKARLLVAFNQEFSNGTALPTDDKDFMFHVWKDQNGRPGADLIPPFLVTVDRAKYPAESFVDVDLSPYEGALTNLAGPVYVGFMEDTDDSVGTYVAVDSATTADYSYVYRGPKHTVAPNSWQTMREVSALNNHSLDGFNLMMRAVFEYSDSSSAPRLAVGYLQNPLLSEYIDIVTASDEEIRPASLTGLMTQSTGSVALLFTPIAGTTRAFMDSTQKLSGAGPVSIKIRAAKAFGVFYTDTTISLTARLLKSDEPATVTSPGGAMSIRFERGSVSTPLLVTATDGVNDPTRTESMLKDDQQAFFVGPAGKQLNHPATIFVKVTDGDRSKTIALLRDGRWLALPTVLDQDHGEATAAVSQLGVYGLVNSSDAVGTVSEVPQEYALLQNYPNPFNPQTSISYQIPALSFVTLKVFDVLGREVATLVNESQAAGSFVVRWDAASMPSGLYICRLQARLMDGGQNGEFVQSRKMLLVR